MHQAAELRPGPEPGRMPWEELAELCKKPPFLAFRPATHFELIFWEGVRLVSGFISSARRYPVVRDGDF